METIVYAHDDATILGMAKHTKTEFERMKMEVPKDLDEFIAYCEDEGLEGAKLNNEKCPKTLKQMWNMIPYAPGIAMNRSLVKMANAVRGSLKTERPGKRVRVDTEDEQKKRRLHVVLSPPNPGDRPTEFAYFDEKKGEVVRAVDEEDMTEEFEDCFGEEEFENYKRYVEIKGRFDKCGRVEMNDGYNAKKVFEEFLEAMDDEETFEALEERYSYL